MGSSVDVGVAGGEGREEQGVHSSAVTSGQTPPSCSNEKGSKRLTNRRVKHHRSSEIRARDEVASEGESSDERRPELDRPARGGGGWRRGRREGRKRSSDDSSCGGGRGKAGEHETRGGERCTRGKEGVVGSGSEEQLGPDEASPNTIQPINNDTMPPHRTTQLTTANLSC